MISIRLALVAVLLAGAAPACAECTLRPSGGKWAGSCGTLVEGGSTSLAIAPAAAITSGVYRRGETPGAVWAGTMRTGDGEESAVEIEVYAQGRGVLRTIFGWFAVFRFTAAENVLRLDVDASREVPPSEVDREIVRRAGAILSTEAAWNRADDRKCPAAATTWSIYCAMEKATVDVSGAFHHRRPALQVVRAIVDERTANRRYHHRLMDYNNDPTTRLADVQSLFAEALTRMDTTSDPSTRSSTPRPGPPR